MAGLKAGLARNLFVFATLFSVCSCAAQKFDPATTVFIGSSTIEFWKTLDQDFKGEKTVNLGVGGTTYAYLVEHAGGYAAKYPARHFVVYSGDNDLEAGVAPRTVVEQFKRVAEILHEKLPQAAIVVISVKPCPLRRKNMDRIRETNGLLRIAAELLGYVKFVDIFPQMLNAKGEPRAELFREDGLHMNKAGYQLWTEALRVQLSHLNYSSP